MQITASLVNELRQKTGVGMMQCKKALTETDGDMDKAVELLRKQGAAVAAKRADKAAKEGRVYLVETADKAAAFELSCETEPVSNNDDFVALAGMAVKAVETQAISSVDDLKNAVVDGKKINDVLQDVLVKIQENIDFRKFAEIKKVANFEGTASDEAALKQAAKDIAMQAAAFAPVALNDASVPAETIEKEKEIAKAQIEASGKQTKPEFMQRQIDGRVAKVLKEIVLEDQEFFMSEKNPKKLSVKDYLQEVVAKQLGLSSLKVVNFIRFERGNAVTNFRRKKINLVVPFGAAIFVYAKRRRL